MNEPTDTPTPERRNGKDMNKNPNLTFILAYCAARRAEAEAATAGPWRYDSYSTIHALHRKPDTEICQVPPDHGDTAIGEDIDNATFIASARQSVPLMLDVIEAQAKALVETITHHEHILSTLPSNEQWKVTFSQDAAGMASAQLAAMAKGLGKP